VGEKILPKKRENPEEGGKKEKGGGKTKAKENRQHPKRT